MESVLKLCVLCCSSSIVLMLSFSILELPKADHSISAIMRHEKQLHWHIFYVANRNVVALWKSCEKHRKNKKLPECSLQSHIIKCQRAMNCTGWAELVFWVFCLVVFLNQSCKSEPMQGHTSPPHQNNNRKIMPEAEAIVSKAAIVKHFLSLPCCSAPSSNTLEIERIVCKFCGLWQFSISQAYIFVINLKMFLLLVYIYICFGNTERQVFYEY